jgi:Plasmid encoded RepA protein
MIRKSSSSGLVKAGQLLLDGQVVPQSFWDQTTPDKLPALTAPRRRFIENVVAIKEEPEAYNTTYLARELVQCTLPHRDPGSVPSWERRNGRIHLGITPGWDFEHKESIGFPYGIHPRLLLYWITTEAARTHSKTLYVGASYSAFIRKLGLNSRTGGGVRGTHKSLRNQVRRLFAARISFQESFVTPTRNGHRWMNMEVTKGGELWWDPRDPDLVDSWEGYISLGDVFYEAITATPVPVDFRHLRALKKSPLTLDLYAWLTYKAHIAMESGKDQFGPWGGLTEQFGSDYKRPRAFRENALDALVKIQAVYDGLRITATAEGIRILASSKPAIPPRIMIAGA